MIMWASLPWAVYDHAYQLLFELVFAVTEVYLPCTKDHELQESRKRVVHELMSGLGTHLGRNRRCPLLHRVTDHRYILARLLFRQHPFRVIDTTLRLLKDSVFVLEMPQNT